MPDLDLEIKGGGGRSPPKLFSALQASVELKIGGGEGGPPGPSPGSTTVIRLPLFNER